MGWIRDVNVLLMYSLVTRVDDACAVKHTGIAQSCNLPPSSPSSASAAAAAAAAEAAEAAEEAAEEAEAEA